jgi:hypothetical protein
MPVLGKWQGSVAWFVFFAANSVEASFDKNKRREDVPIRGKGTPSLSRGEMSSSGSGMLCQTGVYADSAAIPPNVVALLPQVNEAQMKQVGNRGFPLIAS